MEMVIADYTYIQWSYESTLQCETTAADSFNAIQYAHYNNAYISCIKKIFIIYIDKGIRVPKVYIKQRRRWTTPIRRKRRERKFGPINVFFFFIIDRSVLNGLYF